MLILLVEDDVVEQRALRRALPKEEFELLITGSGWKGVELARDCAPDVVLLDWRLPDLDGPDACKEIRADPASAQVPIIMVTCLGGEGDVVRGLNSGADDYMVKPLRVEELRARLHAAVRRRLTDGDVVEYGALRMDQDAHRAALDGELLDLTATQFRVLWTLASQPGRVFTREQLITFAIGSHSDAGPRTIDVHVRELRRRLGVEHGRLVQTVRGVGYRFAEQRGVP